MPGKRKSAGLGPPPFDYADRVASWERARDYFFQAIERVAPKVLRDLGLKPWEEFGQIDEPLPRAHNLLEDIRAGLTGAMVWPAVPWRLSAELKAALEAWQQKYRLTEPWCQERALWTLAWWQRKPELGGKEWAYPSLESTVRVTSHPVKTFHVRPFTLRLLGWDPREEPWGSWLKREEINDKLSAYREQVEQDAQEAGLVRTQSKRELLHFEWLARFQIKHERFEDIAAGPSIVSPDAVEVAVRRTAKIIGLTLRAISRTGRPPGRVDTHQRAPRQQQK